MAHYNVESGANGQLFGNFPVGCPVMHVLKTWQMKGHSQVIKNYGNT